MDQREVGFSVDKSARDSVEQTKLPLCLQCRRDRFTAESAEEREARLEQIRARRRERLATESTEERDARLQRRRDQLTTESAEGRELG